MKLLQRMRVPAGVAYAAALVSLAQPVAGLLVGGILLSCLGLALRIWAAGCIEKGRFLARSGPYRWTRNPLYLGSSIMGLGFSLAGSRHELVAAFIVLFPILYYPVMRREEEELRRSFGPDFEAYSREVPLFFPRLRPATDPAPLAESAGFRWSRVLSNREYNALAGFLALAAYLYLRLWWT